MQGNEAVRRACGERPVSRALSRMMPAILADRMRTTRWTTTKTTTTSSTSSRPPRSCRHHRQPSCRALVRQIVCIAWQDYKADAEELGARPTKEPQGPAAAPPKLAKRGDYQLRVHVIEARGLVGRDAGNSCDPQARADFTGCGQGGGEVSTRPRHWKAPVTALVGACDRFRSDAQDVTEEQGDQPGARLHIDGMHTGRCHPRSAHMRLRFGVHRCGTRTSSSWGKTSMTRR